MYCNLLLFVCNQNDFGKTFFYILSGMSSSFPIQPKTSKNQADSRLCNISRFTTGCTFLPDLYCHEIGDQLQGYHYLFTLASIKLNVMNFVQRGGYLALGSKLGDLVDICKHPMLTIVPTDYRQSAQLPINQL